MMRTAKKRENSKLLQEKKMQNKSSISIYLIKHILRITDLYHNLLLLDCFIKIKNTIKPTCI